MLESAKAKFEAFLCQSKIPFVTPGSSDFASLQQSFTGSHDEQKPSFITKPQCPKDIADIVQHCSKHDIPIVVRGGGHDMFGRFTALGAVSIDMRDLNSVQVSADKKTARIGGGITNLKLLRELECQELQVPVGSCGTVGYTGWCTLGGLGPYINSYGLGADQIVAAKIINAEGSLIEANDRMLKGIRGGGGNMGVVAELTVKVYPREEVQAGVILYESSDIPKTIHTFFNNYNKLLAEHNGLLPKQLYLMPTVLVFPGLGLTLTCCLIWNGAASDESRAWVANMNKLAEIMPKTPLPQEAIKSTTVLGFSQMYTDRAPKNVLGRSSSVSVSHYSPEVIATLAKVSDMIPRDACGGINFHTLRLDSPSCFPNVPDSVCPYREPHIAIELLGLGDESSAEKAAAWAAKAQEELSSLADSMKQTYLPLTAPENVNLENIYGVMLDELKKLKEEFDPKGIFNNALPRIAS